MNFYFLTLFPDLIKSIISSSIIGRSVDKKIISVETVNIRDFTKDKHRRVDDYPYGGGSGMLMQVEPVYMAYKDTIKKIDDDFLCIYLSPHGEVFNQNISNKLSTVSNIIFLCGHYEGIDQRAIDLIKPYEISVGDFIVTGGELPACLLMDSIARNIKGVLGNHDSLNEESFSNNLLEYPQYTRPASYMNLDVPDVLLSGNHALIEKWRRDKALELTKIKRPDLLDSH